MTKFSFDSTDELLSGREDLEEEEGLVALELDDVSLQYLLSRLKGKNIAVLVRSNREVLEMVKRIEHLGFFATQSSQEIFTAHYLFASFIY